MLKQRMAFGALLAVSGLVLAGCAGVEEPVESADSADESTESSETEESMGDGELSLEGMTVGVAVVGTQHFWDREAFQGAVDEVERLGGEVLTTDGGRDNTVHAENHDIFLAEGVDAVVTILGDDAVEPKLEALKDAGIPVFGVDRNSPHAVNNSQSQNDVGGYAVGEILGEAMGGEGNVAVFNAFGEALDFCGVRYDNWRAAIEENYPDIVFLEPELAEAFANAPEDARQQTLTLLERYPEGELDAIHVACWDQPAIGVVQALEEAGRTEVLVSAFDAGPDTLEIMMEDGSPFIGNVAQQPRAIAIQAVQNLAAYLAGEDVPEQSYVEVYPVAGQAEAQRIYDLLGYGS